MVEDLRKKIQSYLVEYLILNYEFRCFAMGSICFEYQTFDSDIDICICNPKDEWKASDLKRILYLSGFKSVSNEPHMLYPGELYSNGYIHVVVVSDEFEFEILRKQHDRIHKLLKRNPELGMFIKGMKNALSLDKGTGAQIYRTLKGIAEYSIPKED